MACSPANMFAAIVSALSLITLSHAVNFQLSSFDSSLKPSVIQLEGNAVYKEGGIELINQLYYFDVGRAMYDGKVPLWDSDSEKLADFTTHFSFTIDTLNSSTYGDGFAFFLAPARFPIPLNSAGFFFGLFNTTTNTNADGDAEPVVTVEFDTWSNSWDPPFSHVGINRNSISSLKTEPWNVSLHSGDPADAWIVYDATTKNLSVYWSYGGGPNSSLHYSIDLKKALPQWVNVGFSASTGLNRERTALHSWRFSSSLDMEEGNKKGKKKTGLIIGLTLPGCLFVGLFVVAFVVWRKGRDGISNMKIDQTSMNDDLERAGPRRFSYKELALATYNFTDERKLGEGGFGRVYKGHLLDLDLPVAVKKFSGGSNKAGKRQYTTEVKIISTLRHRNLVRLIGWCHDEGEFLLVYEFMPNGSLDHHLFSKRNTTLNDWTLRYKIALGLASSLLYLHEEWEQCVIHRDIKSSNVMLDSGFNVKLGDFGLARLMDHGLDPKTTGLAGTFGYMAPEYVVTRRASKESDVYSFGVVALEIVAGRKSVEAAADEEDEHAKVLLEWIWDLYGKGLILSGVDERLRNNFDAEQAERLMVVGLWCAHPDSSLRPSIRQAILVLNFEAELPPLAAEMPVAMYRRNVPRDPSVVNYTDPLSISSSLNSTGR